ncbi:putative cytochrome P450 [Mycolicibacterium hassiacum DSM 44199]|uniref:Steroid C26-monooxygenase n=1 Tax=Mycolicibacterium hassiacum (strain DSM 44199 / CIP 105218 / JCM 12690 / 3849) TaxID=1122247 RepID=K5B9W9_MYCHD|nr:cytochrome P450 [Mycolicibacterium hassiacum]EKF21220.1 putative cytochrome P450 [Mycolicibacterium hassiacum DSM 44199]PZN22969.1 MAG: cytochrome P450 [Mycolicibacterium hassiacum]VCT89036.1 Putative cytochrome P450 YjiB [Mycolicibacterium hassiacum DSM 44199]
MLTTVPLHSPDFYAGDPYPAYRELRATTPVVYNDVTNFWALLKYEDIRYVSSHPQLFSSTKGITIPDPDQPEPVQEGALIFTDPPRHRQLRKLINTAFTRRQVALLEPKVRQIVYGIFEEVKSGSVQEFAESFAAPLPTRMIAELLGASPDDWERFRRWSDACTGTADPEIELDAMEAIGELFEYFQQLIADRRNEPRNDMMSVLAHAEVDGARLSDEDLLNFAFLLLVAGNETTRNLIALGTLALIEHPEQRQKLIDNPALIPNAVEEMLRYTSPVTHMARHATEDVEIRGQLIRKGETVVMLYGSANRDEEIFGDDAEEFNVERNPNPHIAFGCGEHSCIGAQLARLEARVFFEVLLGRYPKLELVGDVDRMRATMVPGVKRMPVRMEAGV